MYHCPPPTAEVLDRDESKLFIPSSLVHLSLEDADDLSGMFAGGNGEGVRSWVGYKMFPKGSCVDSDPQFEVHRWALGQ